MREVKHRSAWPVYIAAGVFILYSLIFPLYALWHFLAAAVVTAAAWLVADALIKPVIEYVPEPEPEPVSYGEEADAILAEARKAREEMEQLSVSLGDEAIDQKISSLLTLSDRIALDATEDAADVGQIRKFQTYFLPSTISLLHAYSRMYTGGTPSGENISRTRERILEMLDMEIAAFEKQLDALYANDAINIDTDIQVMQKLLEREGLLDGDDLHDLLRRAQAAAD